MLRRLSAGAAVLRIFIAGVVIAPLLVIVFLLAFAYAGIASRPLVDATPSARQDDIERLKGLVYAHDPRRLADGEVRTLEVSERDLNIALRSVLPRSDRQRARVTLERGLGTVDYTLELPAIFPGDYFNLSLGLGVNGREMQARWLQAGDLRIPGWVLAPLVAAGEGLIARQFEEYRDALDAIQAISLQLGELALTYRWDKALARQIENRGREAFLPGADRDRLLAYYREVSAVSRQAGGSASLSRLLERLFSLAAQRSVDGDSEAENRALLLVLGTILNRSSIFRLVGGDPDDVGPMHYYVRWTLAGRNDLAQHFAISAAIAVAGGSVLADAIGAYKELDDSRGGSGFSFADLLADRAGVELAEAAIGAEAGAVQRIMSADGLRESDFMPPMADLPEGIMELEFRQRYRDLDDARYGYVKKEIDTRIALLPLHRQRS